MDRWAATTSGSQTVSGPERTLQCTNASAPECVVCTAVRVGGCRNPITEAMSWRRSLTARASTNQVGRECDRFRLDAIIRSR